MRRVRHNRLVQKLRDDLFLGRKKPLWLETEKVIRTSVGNRIPDLLLIDSDKRGFVVDVQVNGAYERIGEIHQRKVEKYAEWPEVAAYLTAKGATSVTFMALTLVYNGIFAKNSYAQMRMLGISQSQLLYLAVATIEGSCMIFDQFRTSTRAFWSRVRSARASRGTGR
jgi:hypothetical protein